MAGRPDFNSRQSREFSDVSFGASTAVTFQVQVFWVVTPRSAETGNQIYRDSSCTHLHKPVRPRLDGFFSLPPRPDHLLAPPNLLSKGGSFSGAKRPGC